MSVRAWLTLLVLSALVVLGMPTLASAHEGSHDDAAAMSTWTVAPPSDVETNAPVPRDLVFETAATSNMTGCTFLCCCCQGMSRCGPSGSCSASSNAPAGSGFVPDVQAMKAPSPKGEIAIYFDPVFGLERPPKA